MATADEVGVCNQQGIALAHDGRWDEAATCFRRAVELQPNSSAAHNNLGNILSYQGQLAEAVACYRKALELLPDDAATLNNLSNALRQLGELDLALTCCQRAVTLAPRYAEGHSSLGLIFEAKEDLDNALFHCQMALQLRPEFPEALSNLGRILRRLGRLDEAVAAGREALKLRPDFAEAHYNLGNTFLRLERWDEAVACFKKSLDLRPDLVEARVSLAGGYLRQDRLDEASALCDEALRQKPKLATAHNIQGAIFHKQGRLDEAMARFDDALRLEPDLAEAHFNRALVRLQRGDFQEGFREYQWRWKCKDFVIRAAQTPLWDGEPLTGKSILLCADQGLGDTLQFIRYAPLVKQQAATVIVACAGPLIPLLGRCAGIDRLVPLEGALPQCDTHVPLLSLPAILGTTLDTIPWQVPYLFADQVLVEHLRRELLVVPGFKVGIAWKGNSKQPFDGAPSVPLAQFGALALPGVHLLSLQKGEGSEQLEEVAEHFAVTDLGRRLDETGGAFLETAAVIKNLDLVITTDAAIAHLAGGLGMPVWVALPFVADWRWLLDREDSPWYPTMRLFRQKAPGQWDDVFARMAGELNRLVGRRPWAVSIPIEIAPGELIDKITILQIKRERLADPVKLASVEAELQQLLAARDLAVRPSPQLTELTAKLQQTNLALWDIEEVIRASERAQDFGPRFIQLARSIYLHNDRRLDLKREINEFLGSGE